MVTAELCGELESFFGKFINLSHYGHNATLVFKCVDGTIDVNLSATFGMTVANPMPSTMPTETRQSKPSQVRRRIRRKEAKKPASQEEKICDDLPDVPQNQMFETANVEDTTFNNGVLMDDSNQINSKIESLISQDLDESLMHTPPPIDQAVVAAGHPSRSGFWTTPYTSCCDHFCRPDLVDDPDFEFCCLHRCRKPWNDGAVVSGSPRSKS